jgi:hypothetical protein
LEVTRSGVCLFRYYISFSEYLETGSGSDSQFSTVHGVRERFPIFDAPVEFLHPPGSLAEADFSDDHMNGVRTALGEGNENGVREEWRLLKEISLKRPYLQGFFGLL